MSGIGYQRHHTKYHDRGNQIRLDHRNAHNLDLIVQNGLPPRDNRTLSDILWEAKTSCPLNSANCFIPFDKLSLALNRHLAQLALGPSDISESKKEALLNKICVDWSTPGHPSFFRIFAILVMCDNPGCISKFIELKIDDSCLPLPNIERKGNGIKVSSLRYENSRKIPNSKLEELFKDQRVWTRNNLNSFNSYQWWAIAPFFSRPEKIIPHYVLEANDMLPFTEKTNKIDIDMQSLDQDVKDLMLQGGFGDVFIVKLHPSHYSFHDQPYSDGSHSFALKCLKSRNPAEFKLEVDALRKYNYGIDDHLIPLLATIEKDDDVGKYYMLFPKANGDLRHFWERQFCINPDDSLIPWMAKQSVGIAGALSILHKDQNMDNGQDFPIYGRHGDIKAGNILWFAKPGVPGPEGWCLVLSDFGLTTFHRAISISIQTASKLSRTITYQAPEFELEGRKVSRKSDIWALGCTFLDFITCYIRGYDAVDREFPSIRGALDKNSISEDKFYWISKDGRSAKLKPSVKEWISDLRQRPKCSEYLRKFLTFIEVKMLCIEVAGRPTASDVAHYLESLRKTL
ncbi:kinase-like protein [Annulohypoxylon maeteangense]|uniref:kinase-like protein n=1 Tax=Annulohypoxylon maeteangense TaxID=1927788 RepID=UPI0020088927|nr:kinase-like protein [Annulohypoxylon maeteangense]KAI0888135.1 kinase-like protein [Annulohypoxylon maeteangense]